MSEIKRAVFTTLEPHKNAEKSDKKPAKTWRIRVVLPESNEEECPIFNFKDELTAAKKKVKQNGKDPKGVPNGIDPFDEENDDDVRRIAQQMEAKYGAGYMGGTKKKRRGRKDDYADIGMGYDESDSFIDNTDGYDEIIPHNVTTARGGFYINSGALEFKTDDDASSGVSSSSGSEESGSEDEKEEENEENGDKSRKRALDTSDEGEKSDQSSAEKSDGQKKQNGDKPNISMAQAIKKKLFSPDKIKIKKRKLEHQKIAEKKSSEVNSDIKENKKPMKLSSVDDAIDSVIGRGDLPQKSPLPVVAEAPPKLDAQPKIVEKPVPEPIPEPTPPPEIVKLPENLPSDILEIIEKIKMASEQHRDVGKVKFFSGEVNNMLLSLERKCKVLGRSSRVKVYEHLAPFVKCRKETLVKRAKNLVYEEESKKLKNTIDSLKRQIDLLMPALAMNHQTETERILQRKFSAEAAENEDLKNLKVPRKRFPLHDEMKKLLRDVITFKRRCLLHEGKAKQHLEELLNEYLKVIILPLWPDGWMSINTLKKFCTPIALKTPDPKAIQKPKSITITPVNLNDKLAKVEKKENGVAKAVIKETHCQIIDLTDTPSKPDLEQTLKTKFPGLSVTATSQNDKDDVQKVMESLLALQKLSSPSKSEAVSVIAYKNSDRTNDEFQKQFMNSLNHNKPSCSSKSFNECS